MTSSIDFETPSPRFSVKNEQSLKDGLIYLEENGYVVISDVLDEDQLNHGKDLIWKYLKEASNGTIRRHNPNTWSENWPSFSSHGVMNRKGIGQSEFLWHVRSCPDVKKVFQTLWNTEELIVSFDGCGIFRDWGYNAEWKTKGGWNHVDQNPIKKPNLACVQGLVTIFDQNDKTGGLIVYPRTHLRFNELTDLVKNSRDFLLVPDDHPVMNNETTRGKLVHAKAGDIILWDSRTIHCNSPAMNVEQRLPNQQIDLLRVVAYVCMMPVSSVTELSLEEFRQKRLEIVENQVTLTHWSNAFAKTSQDEDLKKISITKFTDHQKALIFGY